MAHNPPTILFVCTGNVFRSRTAEFACRNLSLGKYDFRSAGTRAGPDVSAWPYVEEYLQQVRLDTSSHQPRLLDAALAEQADLLVAMNHDHQEWMKRTFAKPSFLFMEIATGKAQAMPDASDLFALKDMESEASRLHIAKTIDQIMQQSAQFIERLPLYLR